jgi:hypothetical protein
MTTAQRLVRGPTSCLWAVVVGVALTSGSVRADEPGEAALRERLSGLFREAPGAENASARDAGVKRAVEALFVVFRPLASGRITDGNPVFPSVRIGFQGDEVSVDTPPVSAASPACGAVRSMFGLNRETNQLVQTLDGDALVQRTWTKAGSRTTRFVPSADGKRLTLQIEIRSDRLPVPVTYAMEYERVETVSRRDAPGRR